jgi:hypothetical protein
LQIGRATQQLEQRRPFSCVGRLGFAQSFAKPVFAKLCAKLQSLAI